MVKYWMQGFMALDNRVDWLSRLLSEDTRPPTSIKMAVYHRGGFRSSAHLSFGTVQLRKQKKHFSGDGYSGDLVRL